MHKLTQIHPTGYEGISGDGPAIGYYIACKDPECNFVVTCKTKEGISDMKKLAMAHAAEKNWR